MTKKWTAEDRIVLERMLKEGATYTQLGLHFGVTRNAVGGTIDRMGLQGVSPKSAPGRPWSDADQKLTLSMRERGKTCKEIGARIGRSYEAVERWPRKHGYKRPPSLKKPRPQRPRMSRIMVNSGAIAFSIKARQSAPPRVWTDQPTEYDGAAHRVSLLARKPNGCCYVIGDPKDERPYCGHARLAGTPYCGPHRRRMYLVKQGGIYVAVSA